MKKSKPVVIESVPNRHLKMLGHTARMQLAMTSPRNNGEDDYARVIAGYRGEWSGLSPAQKKSASKTAAGLPGMTPKLISAAVAALED